MERGWAVLTSSACSKGSLEDAVVPTNCLTSLNCRTVSNDAANAVTVLPTRSSWDCASMAQSKLLHAEPGAVTVAMPVNEGNPFGPSGVVLPKNARSTLRAIDLTKPSPTTLVAAESCRWQVRWRLSSAHRPSTV